LQGGRRALYGRKNKKERFHQDEEGREEKKAGHKKITKEPRISSTRKEAMGENLKDSQIRAAEPGLVTAAKERGNKITRIKREN